MLISFWIILIIYLIFICYVIMGFGLTKGGINAIIFIPIYFFRPITLIVSTFIVAEIAIRNTILS
jgi:hypothetical protein